jgi:p-aminobenzoyl-glutamate transporter AbgT
MCVTIAISAAILFLILTPGVLLRIPEKGPLLNAAIVHAVVFGILFYFISKIIYQDSKVENFEIKRELCQEYISFLNNKKYPKSMDDRVTKIEGILLSMKNCPKKP